MNKAENEITEITRRALSEIVSGVDWAGRLEEPEFLGRLYDLSSMPSTDVRVSDAGSDIHIHRVTWNDWPSDWVFTDERFNLMEAPDEEFLRFLCETVHPAVRPDADASRKLVVAYNRELAGDGYALVEAKQISGRPVYSPQKSGQRIQVFDEPTGWRKVDRQLQEAHLRLDTAETEEQFQAVGLLCREALITVSQEVFDPKRHVTHDGKIASQTDAKRMLDAVLARGVRETTPHQAFVSRLSGWRFSRANKRRGAG